MPAPARTAAARTTRRTAAADWTALGTSVRLVVTDPTRLDRGRALLEARLARVDAACSRFRADSELTAVNAAAGTAVAVSPLLADAVAVALRAAARADGIVDPTVGRAVLDAGYDTTFALVDPVRGTVRIPQPAPAAWRRVVLDRERRVLTVPGGVRLDLGTTAKALAADRAAAALAAALGCGVLVSLGGDVAVGGEAPAGGWAVRAQDVTGHPGETPGGPFATVALRTGGLATSSTTARRWCRDGRVLHHLIDPRTAVPAVSPWRTASVAAASCVEANTASTAAVVVLGEDTERWLAARGLPARLVGVDGAVRTVGGWPA